MLLASALLLPVGLAVFLWRSNTRDLTIEHVVAEPVVPGGSVTLPVDPDTDCGPSFERLYRESFGRWRQTHRADDGVPWHREEVSIWSWPRTRQEFTNVPCPIGDTVTLTIPEDVRWSPVAACDFGNESCVRVEVAR